MTNYNKLYEIAADNYGLITNEQAHDIGVSTRNLNDMARRGRLVRIGYGVYQLSHYIPTELDCIFIRGVSIGHSQLDANESGAHVCRHTR